MTQNQQFPNYQQSADSNACGPFCLLNIYKYFGNDKGIDDIYRDLNVTPAEMTYLSQLARSLNNNGYKTTIVSCVPYYLSYAWNKLTKPELIDRLKLWLTHNVTNGWKHDCLQTLFYLQEGGTILIEDINSQIIDEELEKGRVIVCCVIDSWLWEDKKLPQKTTFDDIKGSGGGHFVVVYGKTQDSYLISDPYPTNKPSKHGLYETKKDHLLTCVLMNNPQILSIKKK